MASSATGASGASGFPGQRLGDEKKELEGQVLHKRNYGNKLLFLQLDDASQSEAIFSFEVYGDAVRKVRKEIALGDRVRCVGTWRDCGRIMDVFSYCIQQRWVDVAGGASFQAPDTRRARGETEAVPEPPLPEMRRRRLCKFWMSNGTCMRSQCTNFHPEGDDLKEAKTQWRQEQAQRSAQNALPEDPHENKKGHAQRAAVFADWLCETFGSKLFGGVLDIAGGRGELAFELSVKRGIPCTVLDPRRSDGADGGWQVSRAQRLWLRGQGLRSYGECQDRVAESPLKQRQGGVEDALAALENEGSEEWSKWQDVLKCEVLVGLHPDQATGGVLQLAAALRRPFAVVPCCTFADEFPERQVQGRPVRTYEDLVEWLMASGAQKDFLMFFGKNLVVYKT